MVNPAFPKNQLVGVFNLELARMYGYLYQKGKKNFAVLHAMDGYDEVSLTGPVKMISNTSEIVLTPESFGVNKIAQSDIYGGETVQESATIFSEILSGNGTEPQNNVVCANAGLAISTVTGCTIQEGFNKAKESLMRGNGLNALNKLRELSS
jgi:anthranilate phosphoribosyltransferase